MSRVCAKVNFTRDIASKCIVDTSIERCENGEHILGVDFVFLLAFAVKISRWHYFCSHPRTDLKKKCLDKKFISHRTQKEDHKKWFSRPIIAECRSEVLQKGEHSAFNYNLSLRSFLICLFLSGRLRLKRSYCKLFARSFCFFFSFSFFPVMDVRVKTNF